MASELTDKQEQFCLEYLIDLNATQAAIRAGYSEPNADKIGSELLGKPRVKERIQQLMDKRQSRTEVTADMILKELLLIAKTDLIHAFDERGNLKNIKDIPEETRRAISGIETVVDRDGEVTKKLKLWDKPKTLELLGRHLKLFTDKIEHSGSIKTDALSDEELDLKIKKLVGEKK